MVSRCFQANRQHSTREEFSVENAGIRGIMEQMPLNSPGKYSRLDQCFLCKKWYLEKVLSSIEVPDQTGWIEKKACQSCLKSILSEDKAVSP